MRPNNGTIHYQALHIRVIGEVLVHSLPYFSVAPAGIALVDAIPVAIFGWQLAPLRSSAQEPVDALNETTAIGFFPGVYVGTLVQKLIDF